MDEEITGIKTRKIKEQEIDSIYEGLLDFESIKKNPILKPVSEINKTYINFELIINRALWEYQQDEEKINAMIEENPIYSETQLMAKVQSMKNSVKQIIHSQDLQKENMKNAINDMITIVGKEYGPIDDEENLSKNNAKSNIEMKKTPIDTEETGENKEVNDTKFHSDLLDREFVRPKNIKDNTN